MLKLITLFTATSFKKTLPSAQLIFPVHSPHICMADCTSLKEYMKIIPPQFKCPEPQEKNEQMQTYLIQKY